METIFVPTYAKLSMGYFELTFYRICINEFGETRGQVIFENWCQFLDHCKPPLEKTKIDAQEIIANPSFYKPFH